MEKPISYSKVYDIKYDLHINRKWYGVRGLPASKSQHLRYDVGVGVASHLNVYRSIRVYYRHNNYYKLLCHFILEEVKNNEYN